MNLKDQLDELRVNMLRDTSDLVPGDLDDRLFSDRSLLRYIKDAEMRFARQTMCLLDSHTSIVATVTLKSDVATYMLHKSVLSVISARFADRTVNLNRIGQAEVRDILPLESEMFSDPGTTAANPGEPLAFYTDDTTVFAGRNQVTITVYPKPSATEDGDKVYLRVVRTPITDYSLNDLQRESEIPEDYQLDVLHWAAYRALSHFDSDKGSSIPADKHRAAFEEAVKDARMTMRRKTFAPAKISYGTTGFNWDR